VSSAWAVFSFLTPPLATVLVATIIRPLKPREEIAIALNSIFPGCGLTVIGRPTIEVVLGVLFGQVSLILTGGIHNLWMYVPSMAVGGVWALLHTSLSPLARAIDHDEERLHRRISESEPASVQSPTRRHETPRPDQDDAETIIANHYCVEVHCTECGAAVPVPVLHHMAHCSFCGSDHLVVGHEETLLVTLPERVYDHNVLREALLDHYRYQHYLKLYRRTVAPLARSTTEVSHIRGLVSRSEVDAATEVAEVAVSRKADAYRSKLAHNLHVGHRLHFLTPYRHGMGTLYQAAFGRSPRDHEKLLRFDVGTIEAAVAATPDVDLPPMGKLSYLKALRPAVDLSPDLRTLPLEGDDDDLARAFGDLDRKGPQDIGR